jgi:hypothetical protein
MWFVDWLRRTNITVSGYPKKYRCAQPADMKNTLLKDYRPDVESCTPWNPLFTIIISTSLLQNLYDEYTVVLLLPFQVSLQIYYEPKVDQHHNIQQKRGIQNHQSRLLVHNLYL